MSDNLSEKCKKCSSRSYFNYPGQPRKFCRACKEPGMINVVRKPCIGCNMKQPSFNYPNKRTPLYCFDCKLPTMVNVVCCKKCLTCKVRRADYNLIGMEPSYCSDCKESTMIEVRSKRCIECKLRKANYGYNNKPLYCRECKESDMRCYNNKKSCIKCESRIAYYNFEDKRGAKYCSTCQEPGMVNKVYGKNRGKKFAISLCSDCNTNIGYHKLFGRIGLFCDSCKTTYCISIFTKSIQSSQLKNNLQIK